MGNGLTNEAVIDLVKAAGLDWHAGFNLDDENRYGTLVRLAFDLGVAQMAPAALSAPNWGNRRTDSLAGWINELATLGDHPKGMDGWLRHAIKTIASGLSRYATCAPEALCANAAPELLDVLEQFVGFLEPMRFDRASDDAKAIELDKAGRAVIAKIRGTP